MNQPESQLEKCTIYFERLESEEPPSKWMARVRKRQQTELEQLKRSMYRKLPLVCARIALGR